MQIMQIMQIRIQNSDRTKEINFDNIAYTLNELDLGAADTELTTIKGLNQIGEYLSNKSISSRIINIVGYVLGDTAAEMDARKRDLFQIVNPLEKFYIIVDSKYKIELVANDTMRFSVNRYENNSRLCKFQLNATALNPCFSFLDMSEARFSYWKPSFMFPLVMPQPFIMGYRMPSVIESITNTGDVEIGAIVHFKAVAACNNPYLTNITTGETITINKALVAGEEVVINTNYGQKAITGILNGTQYNYFQYLDFDSTFIQLVKGENILRYGASVDANIEVSVTYSPQFLGV